MGWTALFYDTLLNNSNLKEYWGKYFCFFSVENDSNVHMLESIRRNGDSSKPIDNMMVDEDIKCQSAMEKDNLVGFVFYIQNIWAKPIHRLRFKLDSSKPNVILDDIIDLKLTNPSFSESRGEGLKLMFDQSKFFSTKNPTTGELYHLVAYGLDDDKKVINTFNLSVEQITQNHEKKPIIDLSSNRSKHLAIFWDSRNQSQKIAFFTENDDSKLKLAIVQSTHSSNCLIPDSTSGKMTAGQINQTLAVINITCFDYGVFFSVSNYDDLCQKNSNKAQQITLPNSSTNVTVYPSVHGYKICYNIAIGNYTF